MSRRMASDAKPKPPVPPPVPPRMRRGSSLFERLSAFLAGAGIGCGVGYYHLDKVS